MKEITKTSVRLIGIILVIEILFASVTMIHLVPSFKEVIIFYFVNLATPLLLFLLSEPMAKAAVKNSSGTAITKISIIKYILLIAGILVALNGFAKWEGYLLFMIMPQDTVLLNMPMSYHTSVLCLNFLIFMLGVLLVFTGLKIYDREVMEP